MPPPWLERVAEIWVTLSLAAAALVAADIFVGGRRQKMGIMDAVWPLTALYWGVVGLAEYLWLGRRRAGNDEASPPLWRATLLGSAHCGAGCALGDVLGDTLAAALGLTLLGSPLVAAGVVAFVLAYAFGIVFQYSSVAPMRGLGVREGLLAAVKIDTLSLLAYQVGMWAAMAARAHFLPGLTEAHWSYWLMMQVAMVLGFATTYPVNWWLIRRGIKERM